MKNIISTVILSAAMTIVQACSFLDLEPKSALGPDRYLTSEDNICAYATDLYNVLTAHEAGSWGYWRNDAATDNIAYSEPSDCFAPSYWKVSQTGGSYDFTEIYRCNYFFDHVLDNFKQGKISGSLQNIRHYIGEVYFFRAYCYFQKLKALGDFPIITYCPSDDFDKLIEESKRIPRSDVARFIIEDLNTAIEYMMSSATTGGKNRLNADCARLFKSRVALYEGTWLKYFKGTAFVPNGSGWPGKTFNPTWNYKAGDIDKEIMYFLEEAMKESKVIADAYGLVDNTGIFQNSVTSPANPYYNMFSDTDMSAYGEVLLWKQYSLSEGVVNSVVEFCAAANQGYGLTKSMVDAFVMKNGLPIYAASSGYPGDADLQRITENRDSRAEIFIKKPGNRNLHSTPGPEAYEIEPWPNIVNSTASMKYTTGYAMRKGMNFDGAMSSRNKSSVGCIIFRAAEAYLNYMEACYEKNGTLDSDAKKYWTSLRNRSKVGDWQTTISNTDMDKEAETDWGAYSAGQKVDPTLFNIRRERRCELLGEGFRPADIRRWRSLDQMITTPFNIYGVNLWDQLYNNEDFKRANNNNLIEGQNVSTREFSKYMAPYHIMRNNHVFNGYRWNMAHYLDPIAVQHFLITGGGDVDNSTMYQNPGWPKQAGQGAL